MIDAWSIPGKIILGQEDIDAIHASKKQVEAENQKLKELLRRIAEFEELSRKHPHFNLCEVLGDVPECNCLGPDILKVLEKMK